MWEWLNLNTIWAAVSSFFSSALKAIRHLFTPNDETVRHLASSQSNPAADNKQEHEIDIAPSMYPSLPSLPDELQFEISGYLKKDQESQSALISTSNRFYHLFQQPCVVAKLLKYIVFGNQQKVEEILKINPALLYKIGRATDYSGRSIEGTALQMALGAEDVNHHDKEKCMVEMIQEYFEKLPDGEDEMQQQIANQFPQGWEEAEAERAQRDSKALNTVMNAIVNSQNDDDCEKAIQAFRDYLEHENKGKVFKTGKHFNHQLLVNAFNLYFENFDQSGGYESRKNNLCWQKVIGYIQRFVPACVAQAFCQGIYPIVEDNKKLNRNFEFRFNNSNKAVYFPLSAVTDSARLGYEYAVHVVPGEAGSGSQWLADRGRTAYRKYVGNKASNLRSFLCNHGNFKSKRLGA